jgi:hypothetical protein
MNLIASEHDEQVALFQWAMIAARRDPRLRLLFAIPNAGGFSGGFRNNVVRVINLKREGVQPGVPDICLPVPSRHFHGCFLEMKKKGGRISGEQAYWIKALQEQSYYACVAWGFEDAKEHLTQYLRRY